jgi:hypothetical protein
MELKICFTKLVTLDIPICSTSEDVHELIEEVAEDLFVDGEYDDVEWEVTQ